VEIAAPATASHADTGLAASTTYRYRVRAVDGAQNFSGYSNVAEGATTPASTGLVAGYSFNEGIGSSVADASGTANTGTITGATWNTAGKYGNSLTFNGSSHVVVIPSAPSLDLTTGMTLEAWVYPTAAQSGWRAIVQRQTDAYFLHASGGGGSLQPTIGGTFGGLVDYWSAGSSLPLNAWSHLAFTYDGATARLYVDGVEVVTAPRTGALQTAGGGASAVRIGNNVPYLENFLGRIDEVRIYNRALSAAEIAADMGAPLP
jgi:hypothetical protein